ncbi:MAG: hypothetical protein IT371_10315 [Deltaproteobacteria bacterium]|nr:hypothetical protein [Deltaproteobacteria bacterium]
MPRTFRSPRRVGFLLAWAALLLAPSAAHGAFAVRAIELDDADGRIATSKLLEYFNLARCRCDHPVKVIVRITPDLAAKGRLRIVSGQSCLTTTDNKIKPECRVLFAGKLNEQRTDLFIDTSAAQLMTKSGGSCEASEELDYTISVFTDVDDEKWTENASKLTYSVDTKRPVAPSAAKNSDGTTRAPEAGESLVKVSFEQPTTSAEKNVKYQLLCERVKDGQPVLASPPGAEYKTRALLKQCRGSATTSDGGSPRADSRAADAAPRDGGVAEAGTKEAGATEAGPRDAGTPDQAALSPDASSSLPTGIAELDPRYICSAGFQSAGSYDIAGLENGLAYRFYVVSIDQRGNPSLPAELGEATPHLEEDLWERYKRKGGQAEGCAVSEGRGGARQTVVSVASLLLASLVLGGVWLARRTTRRRRAGAAKKDAP